MEGPFYNNNVTSAECQTYNTETNYWNNRKNHHHRTRRRRSNEYTMMNDSVDNENNLKRLLLDTSSLQPSFLFLIRMVVGKYHAAAKTARHTIHPTSTTSAAIETTTTWRRTSEILHSNKRWQRNSTLRYLCYVQTFVQLMIAMMLVGNVSGRISTTMKSTNGVPPLAFHPCQNHGLSRNSVVVPTSFGRRTSCNSDQKHYRYSDTQRLYSVKLLSSSPFQIFRRKNKNVNLTTSSTLSSPQHYNNNNNGRSIGLQSALSASNMANGVGSSSSGGTTNSHTAATPLSSSNGAIVNSNGATSRGQAATHTQRQKAQQRAYQFALMEHEMSQRTPWERVVYPLFELNSFDDHDWFWNHNYNSNNNGHVDSSNKETTEAAPISTALITTTAKTGLAAADTESYYVHPDGKLSIADAAIITIAFVSLIGGFTTLILLSGPGAWRYYLSGGICAALSHIVPVPIDVIKTRKQIDPQLTDRSILEVTRHIIKTDGPISLLGGFGPTAFGYLLEGSIKFGVYEVLKPGVLRTLQSLASLSSWLAFCHTNLMAFLVSACLSGIAASIILCPMEALRIRIVAHPEQFVQGGWMYGGYQIVKKEGAAAFTKGMIPMLLKQVPYTITKNVSFDYITKYIYRIFRYYDWAITANIKLAVPLLSASIASILSCITSQPGDMLLSLVNAPPTSIATACEACTSTSSSQPQAKNCVSIIPKRRTQDIIRDILQSEKGFAGFFVGIQERFVHVGIIVTLQLFIYDTVKRCCGIAATGM